MPDDSDTVDSIADHGVVTGACPTWRCCTGGIPAIAEHPARALPGRAVRSVPADDTIRQTRSPLWTDDALLHGILGLDSDQADIEAASVEVAFADDVVGASWREH